MISFYEGQVQTTSSKTELRSLFFTLLLAPCSTSQYRANLTLTAIHPDGQRPTPSRHIPLGDQGALQDALDRLVAANRMGWGAYFAVGLRKPGLTRWRRGGIDDIAALPALFVDVDDPREAALHRLQCASPSPSCITFTGGGYHAYWWLEEPLTDMVKVRGLLRGLAQTLGGDHLSPAQSLRIPGTVNTKPQRAGALCRIITLNETRYPLTVFPRPAPHSLTTPFARSSHTQNTGRTLNPDLIRAVADFFIQRGFKRSGDWLSGPCPYSYRHKHADQHPSFGFNVRTGYGHCYRCGSMLLKDLCIALNLHPAVRLH